MKILVRAICLMLSLTLAVSVSAKEKSVFNLQQQQAIEKIIQNYIIKNPEVLQKASEALAIKQREDMMSKAKAAIQANKTQLFSEQNPTVGNKDGNIVVVEFFDYQCGHCKKMRNVIEKLIHADKNVKVIFKEFPIFGANSMYATRAALASQAQGKYLVFHDALLGQQTPLTKDKVLAAAKSVGLNVQKLEKAMKDKKWDAEIKANFELASKLGINYTPAVIIANNKNMKGSAKSNGKFPALLIPGEVNLANLKSAIETIQR